MCCESGYHNSSTFKIHVRKKHADIQSANFIERSAEIPINFQINSEYEIEPVDVQCDNENKVKTVTTKLRCKIF